MSLIDLIRDRFFSQEKEDSDLDRIHVSSTGDVYMTGEDLFNDDDESYELIDKLNSVIHDFKSKESNSADLLDA